MLATTRRPRQDPLTPRPVSSTVPATTTPGTNGGSISKNSRPHPARSWVSRNSTPAASTDSNRSPASTVGSGTSTGWSTSGRMDTLLGSYKPPAELFAIARDANRGMQALTEHATAAGRLRTGVTGADLTLLATQLGAVDGSDQARTRELRRRYLTLVLDALGRADAPALPGPAPDAAELEGPWHTSGDEDVDAT